MRIVSDTPLAVNPTLVGERLVNDNNCRDDEEGLHSWRFLVGVDCMSPIIYYYRHFATPVATLNTILQK
jgi:hypothetical protein